MEELNQNEQNICKCWEQKIPRDIVREAATKGLHINLAIKYLMYKNSWDEITAKNFFLVEVTEWTIQLLKSKQIFKVLHILNKMKINPENHLMSLAKVSDDKDSRDFILEQLQKLKKDMLEENIETWENFYLYWNLLRHLEKSFESDGIYKQNKVFGIGKDRIVVTESEIKALTIDKIQAYPEDWRNKVSAALFFIFYDFSLLKLTTPNHVWHYLIENNKAMILIRWINIQMSEVVRDMNARYNFFNNDDFANKLVTVDNKGLSVESLKKLDETFRKWPIEKEMLNDVALSDCYSYTKMCVYDTFCSYGIVNEDEKENINLIISRLARTRNLKLIDDVFTESCSTITKRDFYIQFAKFCVKHQLYMALTICVEGHLQYSDLYDVEPNIKDCIELWLLFKSIEQTSDRQSHVVPVYKTCQQIAKDDIDNYISSNPQLVLGMILLEDNAKLFDIFSKEDSIVFKDFKLPNKGYQDKLPHLYDVYLRYKNVSSMYDFKDVSVYQLLSGYRGLDVSKVFEFQHQSQCYDSAHSESEKNITPTKDHTLKTAKKLPEMPEFSNEKLMKRYGYAANLNHIYYLRQYRPCNASQAFVAQQYQTYNKLQDKSIKSACSEAHALALQNWHDTAFTACAISFISMIGCNPTRCRVHISAAKLIKNHLTTQKGFSDDTANKLVTEYLTKIIQGNEDTAKDLIHYLEDITLMKLAQMPKENVNIATILYESQTVVKFALLHNLPLPEKQLKSFIKSNSWFDFLLFGDIFRYPLEKMLLLADKFENKSYGEHIKHIMLQKTSDEVYEKDNKVITDQKRISRQNSIDDSMCDEGTAGGGLWEVAAACHGPEDPPAALLRAARLHAHPLLVLIACCYEPNAVLTLWSQWILSSLPPALQPSPSSPPSADDLLRLSQACVSAGYVATLHESMLIFMPESPLTILTSFLCRCIKQLLFDSRTDELLMKFLKHCERKYSFDTSGQSYHFPKEKLQTIAVALVKEALGKAFDSAFYQKEFLKSLANVHFGKSFTVSSPNFLTMYEALIISMETPSPIDTSRLLQEDSEQYLIQCIRSYTQIENYSVAIKVAKVTGLAVDEILIAEWKNKHKELMAQDYLLDDKEVTLFVAQCSEAFKNAGVLFSTAVNFLVSHASVVKNPIQRFYCCRLILSWFEQNKEYGKMREDIEHMMWNAYFECDTQKDLFLNSYQSTHYFVLNGQKDMNLAKQIQVDKEKVFAMSLSEIEIASDVGNIQKVCILDDVNAIDRWKKIIHQLLELFLMVDAFRLSALFAVPPEWQSKPPLCPVLVIRTCYKLAEGTLSPYDLPQELRVAISLPYSTRRSLSCVPVSGTSEVSFEELVLISEGDEGCVGAREDSDRVCALEAVCARGGLALARRVASVARVTLMCGSPPPPDAPLKALDNVTGRARLPLANLLFRTFDIPPMQVADYLCREMLTVIISPHLQKTSTFRQKEHFQYMLWGYSLDSDIEMFLNIRPDACAHLGRLIMEHLIVFQKLYKCQFKSKNSENLLDDTYSEKEILVDEDEGNSESNTENSTTYDNDSIYSDLTVFSASNASKGVQNLFDGDKNNVHARHDIKSNIRNITKGAKFSTKQINIICIETLVVAHECATCACDTEGVAAALREARSLAARLLGARSWRLLARMLTGLARYHEMAYVLQALREHHQFEYLLAQAHYMFGQRTDKIAEFQQGLLDFLKKHCSGDTDTYIMVALHFNMYSEAASVKMKQATDLICDLEKMSSEGVVKKDEWLLVHDNAATRALLDNVISLSSEACELWVRAGCAGRARGAAALAQRAALQVALLSASPAPILLNISDEQAYQLIYERLSFLEGAVLAWGRASWWHEVAYRRALAHDRAYLRDMAEAAPHLATKLLDRYKLEKKKTAVTEAAMMELQSLLK